MHSYLEAFVHDHHSFVEFFLHQVSSAVSSRPPGLIGWIAYNVANDAGQDNCLLMLVGTLLDRGQQA
jgi:hypothetical protein